MAILVVAIAYFLGAVPTAYIAGRLLKGIDIRQEGDGNVGAQNAFRRLGRRIGIAVGLIDAAKGSLAVLLAQAAGLSALSVMLAGVAAVIGHNWPVYIGFRGGRGEATTIGIFSVLLTQAVLIASLPALVTLLRTKSVIPASAVLFGLVVLSTWWLGFSGLHIAYSIALPGLVGVTHYARTRQKVIGRA